MRKILLIFCILLSFNASAQSALDFLNSVIEKNKSYADISIIFEYEFKNEENGIHERTGGYASMKGSSYIINIDGQEMICNGETMWTYLIDDQEVMISDVTEDSSSSPIAIIEAFSKNVNVTFEVNSNAELTTLLIKELENDTFETATITVDNDLKLKEITIKTLDGNILIYKITKFTTNQDLPDSMFIFDEKIHPNVEIIDMR